MLRATFFAVAAFLMAAPPAFTQDQFGDPLPKGAVARAGSVRWRHGGLASFVAFLPDGKHVLTAADDGLIRVWEYPGGKLLRQFGPGPSSPPPDAAAAKRQEAAISAGGSLQSTALAADGKTMAVNFNNWGPRLYDVATGKELDAANLFAPQRGLMGPAIAFDPGGKHLAVLDTTGKVNILDRGGAAKPLSFGTARPAVIVVGGAPFVAYSSDGKRLASTFTSLDEMNAVTSVLTVWDSTGKQLHTVRLPRLCDCAAFSPDSRLLAHWEGLTIKVLKADTGEVITKLLDKGFDAFVSHALLFSNDGKRLYATTSAGQIKEWDVATGKELRLLGPAPRTPAGRGVVRTSALMTNTPMALSPDGNVLAMVGQDHAVHFFDLRTGTEAGQPGHLAPLRAVHFTGDGRLVTEGSDALAQLWDAATGKSLAVAKVPGDAVRLAACPDGKRAIAQRKSGVVVLLDVITGKELAALKDNLTQLSGVAISADNACLALRWGMSPGLTLYDLPSMQYRRDVVAPSKPAPQPGQAPPVTRVPPLLVLSDDGRVLVAYSDAVTLAVFHTDNGCKRVELAVPAGLTANAAAFAPDARSLAVDLGDGAVTVYEVATGRIRRVLGSRVRPKVQPSDAGACHCARIAFAPDGLRLAFGDGPVVRVFDITTGKEVAAFEGHTGAVTAVAFAGDGKRLVSASADTTALVWDLGAAEKSP
jgi:WD40 repeat protein